MSEFKVNPSVLLQEVSDYKEMYKSIKGESGKIESIKSELSLSGDSGERIRQLLSQIIEQLEHNINSTKKIYSSLEQIVDKYKKTEQSIVSEQDIKTTNMPFDDEGEYGGNQSNPKNKYEELADIIRKYYPDFTDKEVEDYLKKLESEGCGYVAMANTIFFQFAGKEEEFEKTFGFPMYDKNGELNYNAMVTDFYSATDNHNEKGFLWFKKDDVDKKEDKSDTEGSGTNRASREYRWEKYMREHGIDVDVHNVRVTPDNYEEIAGKGDVVIAVSPCVLYDENGKETCNIDGGHAMTVTGVTDDGMYRVSSWGKEYYVKPSDEVYDRMQFQQIVY